VDWVNRNHHPNAIIARSVNLYDHKSNITQHRSGGKAAAERIKTDTVAPLNQNKILHTKQRPLL
jgi:hypothetical protein